MKLLKDYRNPALVDSLVRKIRSRSVTSVRLMEFCGGHTVAIMKYGLRQLLSPQVELLSGPGCPVCVTATEDIDRAIALAENREIILTTFGDMLRVPGSRSSLQDARAQGANVRVVYSPFDALALARQHSEKAIVFLGIGFETTAPAVALSLVQAKKERIENYFVLSLHKLCPPVMKALLAAGDVEIDGIICPGHVSAIIGATPYEWIPRDYPIGCVIAGFEPLDILLAIDKLTLQVEQGDYFVESAYLRGAQPNGNQAAQQIMDNVFEVCDTLWRGMGMVPQSGLALSESFASFDALHTFPVEIKPPSPSPICACGDILRGTSSPDDCDFFRTMCTPEHPVGPCMVSSEGACAAFFHYEVYS